MLSKLWLKITSFWASLRSRWPRLPSVVFWKAGTSTTTNPTDTSLPAPANDATGAVAAVRSYWKPALAVVAGALLIGAALAAADRSGIAVVLLLAKWGFPAGAAAASAVLVYLHAMATGRVLRWIVLPAMVASLIAAAGLQVYDLGAADGRQERAGEIKDLATKLRAAEKEATERPAEAAALPPLPTPPPAVETPPEPTPLAPRPSIRRSKPRPLPASSGSTLETMKWPF